MEKIEAVFNTSPLIFLTKLEYLNLTLKIFNKIYIPAKVKEEIYRREDDIKIKIKAFLRNENVIIIGE